VNTAVYSIFGAVLIAFGSWRVLAGLYVLELLNRHVLGSDLFVRFVPRWMRGSADAEGFGDILGGLIFALVGVLALVDAF
jgi:hypothetical protein